MWFIALRAQWESRSQNATEVAWFVGRQTLEKGETEVDSKCAPVPVQVEVEVC